MMHPRRTLTTTLLAALASCAPPPDVDTDDPAYSIAAAYCDAFTACDCPGFPEAKTSRSACEQRLIDSVGNPNLAFLRAEYPGVQFSIDPTCLESSEAWAEGLQCDGNSTRPLHCADGTCALELQLGDPCDVSSPQCAEGLACFEGACREVPVLCTR